MDSTAEVRLKKEAAQLTQSPPGDEVVIDPCVGGDPFRWKAVLTPDPASVFAGRHLPLDITMPTTYPASPPRMRFTEPVYHPDITTSGSIDMDALSKEWSPALTIETMLRSVLTLLDEPDVHDPLRPEVAEVYVLAQQAYQRQARHGEAELAS
ncbi:ubiquitin-conjugating enzyme E2 variant [Streptomyces erythrochromogenes]|uniref:ubiquitin-conjugating enzyme E2 variant n=1 Tax=Streptomyces erythrochromogenes TaxID=285574 RepID=UPI003806999A